MGTPTASTTIANMALGHLNAGRVSNIINPSDEKETICNLWYDQTRREVLRKHTWNFATKRTQLNENVTAPLYGYTKAYDLPSDFIRLVSLGTYEDIGDYELENNQLLVGFADVDSDGTGTLNFRYVYDHDTVARFDPLFIKILALEMAMNMAYDLTGSNTSVTRLEKLLSRFAPEGYAIDGQERPPHRIEKSKTLAARRGYRRGSREGSIYWDRLFR